MDLVCKLFKWLIQQYLGHVGLCALRGGSRISRILRKGVRMYNCMGVRFADLTHFS